jgi:regulator of protease activity HflC (stomatin/prohibitin superfamily)
LPDVVNKLVDFILSILRLFQAWTVVDQFEGGVRLRLGKYSGTLTPGFHLMIPGYVDQAMTVSTVPGSFGMEEQSLCTSDGVEVVISVAVLYEIVEPRKFLLNVEDLATVLLPIKSYVGTVVRESTWEELQGLDISEAVFQFIGDEEETYGVEILDVVLVDLVTAMSLRLFSAEGLQSE